MLAFIGKSLNVLNDALQLAKMNSKMFNQCIVFGRFQTDNCFSKMKSGTLNRVFNPKSNLFDCKCLILID